VTALAQSQPVTADEGIAPYPELSSAERYIHQTRDRAFLAMLRRHGVDSLAGRRILEIGCGEGALMRSLNHYGAEPSLFQAIDIAPSSPAMAFASAASLPYREASFDLAFAFTSLSSMANDEIREAAACEALRVVRPGALLLVYDFHLNPTNPNTTPVSETALRSLFAGHDLDIERVTLAPPLVRLLRGSTLLCRALEQVPLLRTHLLAAVTKGAA